MMMKNKNTSPLSLLAFSLSLSLSLSLQASYLTSLNSTQGWDSTPIHISTSKRSQLLESPVTAFSERRHIHNPSPNPAHVNNGIGSGSVQVQTRPRL
jgi:hypothetical protein